jgi:hypothetical protein
MIKKTIVTIFVVLCVVGVNTFKCSALDTETKAKIVITKPQNDSEIGHEEIVRGKVSNFSSGNVYVLVHPLKTNLCWVQRPPVSIDEDGSWQTLCYFGDDTRGIGEYFEIIAVITQKLLKEGETFDITKLPQDAVKSPVITVKRTQ